MKRQSNLRSIRGMATWLKIVLIAGVLCVLGVVGLVVAGGMFFSQMTSPDKIKEVASKFMVIDDPLPGGFKYTAGANIGTPFVVITPPDAKTIVTFFVDPSAAPAGTTATPETAIDGIAKGESVAAAPGGASSAAKRLTKTTRGSLQVGGQAMPYVIGHTEKATDTTDIANTFFGAVKSPTTGKIVYMMAQSADASASAAPITIEKVKVLTDAIKSFN